MRCFIEILQSSMGGSTAGTAQYSPEAPITQERWRRGRHFRATEAVKWQASGSGLRARTVRSATRRRLWACAPRPQVNARCANSCAILRRGRWATDGASPRPQHAPGLARFHSPVERQPSSRSRAATVSAPTRCPWRVNSTANVRVDLVVHRNGDIGSPRSSGSTSRNSAGAGAPRRSARNEVRGDLGREQRLERLCERDAAAGEPDDKSTRAGWQVRCSRRSRRPPCLRA